MNLRGRIIIVLGMLLAGCWAAPTSLASALPAAREETAGPGLTLSWQGEPCNPTGDVVVTVTNNASEAIRLPRASGLQNGQFLVGVVRTGDIVDDSSNSRPLPYWPDAILAPNGTVLVGPGEAYNYYINIYEYIIGYSYLKMRTVGGTFTVHLWSYTRFNMDPPLAAGGQISNILTCPAAFNEALIR